MLTLVGWLGTVLFSICGIPQAIKCYKDGNSDGLSWFFLLAWLGGEVCMLVYIGARRELDYPLLVNYTLNLASLLILLKYKMVPRL